MERNKNIQGVPQCNMDTLDRLIDARRKGCADNAGTRYQGNLKDFSESAEDTIRSFINLISEDDLVLYDTLSRYSGLDD